MRWIRLPPLIIMISLLGGTTGCTADNDRQRETNERSPTVNDSDQLEPIERSAQDIRSTIDRLAAELDMEIDDTRETRSPCPNTPHNDEHIEFAVMIDLATPRSVEILDLAASLLQAQGWSVKRESISRGSYVYGTRDSQHMDIGLVLEGSRFTLSASTGCFRAS